MSKTFSEEAQTDRMRQDLSGSSTPKKGWQSQVEEEARMHIALLQRTDNDINSLRVQLDQVERRLDRWGRKVEEAISIARRGGFMRLLALLGVYLIGSLTGPALINEFLPSAGLWPFTTPATETTWQSEPDATDSSVPPAEEEIADRPMDEQEFRTLSSSLMPASQEATIVTDPQAPQPADRAMETPPVTQETASAPISSAEAPQSINVRPESDRLQDYRVVHQNDKDVQAAIQQPIDAQKTPTPVNEPEASKQTISQESRMKAEALGAQTQATPPPSTPVQEEKSAVKPSTPSEAQQKPNDGRVEPTNGQFRI